VPKIERSPDRCARSYRTPGRVAFEQCHFAYRDDHYYLDKRRRRRRWWESREKCEFSRSRFYRYAIIYRYMSRSDRAIAVCVLLQFSFFWRRRRISKRVKIFSAQRERSEHARNAAHRSRTDSSFARSLSDDKNVSYRRRIFDGRHANAKD